MKKHKITYYFDSLCGWCYGFSPVMRKIYDKYKEQVDFEVFSGGLFLGNRVGPINDVAPYIKAGAYKTVTQRTGVEFGAQFINGPLKNNTMVLNSLPPAIAFCIVKENSPEKMMQFTSVLHNAIYGDGMNPGDTDKYAAYAQGLGINIEDFGSKMKDKKYIEMAREEFVHVASQGIGGYPATVLKIEHSNIALSNGYMDFEELDQKIEQLFR